VSIKSEPSGAAIWRRDGRDYTCTNTLTPSSVELTFHDENDVQKLRLRRFGYPTKSLEIRPPDKELTAALRSDSETFLTAGNDAPLEELRVTLQKEFEGVFLADQDAFRCAPFDLDYIRLNRNKELSSVDLIVAVRLDRSFGGLAFRNASRAANASGKMTQAALDGGIFEILARIRRLAPKFPQIKVVTVVCSYSTTDAVIDTVRGVSTNTTVTPTYSLGTLGPSGTRIVTAQVVHEHDVVKDVDVVKTIAFVVPLDAIPDTLDKKAVSDAVFAAGKILAESATPRKPPKP
jgi:hypothetical protein